MLQVLYLHFISRSKISKKFWSSIRREWFHRCDRLNKSLLIESNSMRHSRFFLIKMGSGSNTLSLYICQRNSARVVQESRCSHSNLFWQPNCNWLQEMFKWIMSNWIFVNFIYFFLLSVIYLMLSWFLQLFFFCMMLQLNWKCYGTEWKLDYINFFSWNRNHENLIDVQPLNYQSFALLSALSRKKKNQSLSKISR